MCAASSCDLGRPFFTARSCSAADAVGGAGAAICRSPADRWPSARPGWPRTPARGPPARPPFPPPPSPAWGERGLHARGRRGSYTLSRTAVQGWWLCNPPRPSPRISWRGSCRRWPVARMHPAANPWGEWRMVQGQGPCPGAAWWVCVVRGRHTDTAPTVVAGHHAQHGRVPPQPRNGCIPLPPCHAGRGSPRVARLDL